MLYLRPRDMARLGQLYLNERVWWPDSYANRTVDAFAAKGWGGQYFVVIHEKNLVFVKTAGASEDDNMWNIPYMFYDLIENFILPALNE